MSYSAAWQRLELNTDAVLRIRPMYEFRTIFQESHPMKLLKSLNSEKLAEMEPRMELPQSRRLTGELQVGSETSCRDKSC